MRFEILHEDKGLAFGRDHACGDFLQIWKRPEDPVERELQDMSGPDEEEMLVDMDTSGIGGPRLTKEMMLQLLGDHGFTLEELQEDAARRAQ